jgi:hypothetical protein
MGQIQSIEGNVASVIPHVISKDASGNIISITYRNETYRIGDIVSYIDELGYEYNVKISGCSFDEQNKKYVVVLEGNGFSKAIFADDNNIKGKKYPGTQLSTQYSKGDRVIKKIKDQEFIVEITDVVLPLENSSTPWGKISYKFSNGQTGYDAVNWGVFLKKVNKYTPLSENPANSKQKKYTLNEDSKYRVKYMKYKAKYLAQKNN